MHNDLPYIPKNFISFPHCPNTCTTMYPSSVRDLQCAFGIKKS